jgi:hypothetical protein
MNVKAITLGNMNLVNQAARKANQDVYMNVIRIIFNVLLTAIRNMITVRIFVMKKF